MSVIREEPKMLRKAALVLAIAAALMLPSASFGKDGGHRGGYHGHYYGQCPLCPRKADMCGVELDVCFVPKADIPRALL
jgi:hypothetical protein